MLKSLKRKFAEGRTKVGAKSKPLYNQKALLKHFFHKKCFSRDKLSQEDGFLNDYYDVTEINFEKDSRKLFYCKNIKGLLERVVVERKLLKGYILKVGIDVEGGFLKVCLNVIEKVTEYKVKKKKFSCEKGIGNEKYKDGGLNKFFIIGLVENAAESHSSFEKTLKLNDLQYLCAFDMKSANIFFEIESAASIHPCSWCNISKKKARFLSSR